MTELIDAITNGNVRLAMQLIQSNAVDFGYVSSTGYTALIVACGYSMSEVAIALIKTGQSKPDYVNENNFTALIFACQNNLTDVALALIHTGQSKPGHITNNARSALLVSCENNLPKVALALIETGDSNPGHVSNNGNTALIFACQEKLTEVALALIETGNSNPGHVSNNGTTALIFACQENLTKVALALLETGDSNPGHASNRGITALILACSFKMTNVALALINTGQSNPGQVSKVKTTALIIACLRNLSTVAIALIKTGHSNPAHICKDGKTALTIAKRKNMTDVINLLETPLQTTQPVFIDTSKEGFDAIQQEHMNIADFLIQSADNVCFMIQTQCYLTNKTTIQKQINAKEYIKYECKKAGSGARYYDESNIRIEPRYFLVSSLFGVRLLVLLDDMKSIVDHKFSNKLFGLVPSGKKLPSMMSQSIFDGDGAVSGDHCQEGTEIEVFTIVGAIASKCAETALVSAAVSTSTAPEPELNTIAVLYKNVKYDIPVEATMTTGNLKTLFLEELLDKGVIADVSLNVKFIFSGKIFSDADSPITEMKNPPFGITVQAMTTPIRAGGKTRGKTCRNKKRSKATRGKTRHGKTRHGKWKTQKRTPIYDQN